MARLHGDGKNPISQGMEILVIEIPEKVDRVESATPITPLPGFFSRLVIAPRGIEQAEISPARKGWVVRVWTSCGMATGLAGTVFSEGES